MTEAARGYMDAWVEQRRRKDSVGRDDGSGGGGEGFKTKQRQGEAGKREACHHHHVRAEVVVRPQGRSSATCPRTVGKTQVSGVRGRAISHGRRDWCTRVTLAELQAQEQTGWCMSPFLAARQLVSPAPTELGEESVINLDISLLGDSLPSSTPVVLRPPRSQLQRLLTDARGGDLDTTPASSDPGAS